MANIEDPASCRNCGRPLPRQHGKGRVRQYCDATCRSAARRRRVTPALTAGTRKGYVDDNGLAAVVEARERARDAEEALRLAVERARQRGHTWQEIGEVLGTSRQAAFQRFGRPVDPRTGEDMAVVPGLPGAPEKAVALFADLVAGRWAEVRRDFDPRLAAGLSTGDLVEVWAQAVGMVGAYERMGEPITLRAGAHTVVNVPLHCEAGTVTGRVAFDDDGRVGGLFLLPA
jgi:hypothetical protein